MTLPSWDNNGPFRYDYAINGTPYLGMTNPDYPYLRQTYDSRRQQIDLTAEPGEQSLQGWWYRAQSSFDFGAGVKFFDTARDASLSRRFADSHGVEVFEEGEVALLRKTTRIDLDGNSTPEAGKHRAIGFANAGEEGVLVSTGNTIRKVLASGSVSTVNWGGSGTILDLATDGGAYYVATATEIYRGLLPDGTGTKIYDFNFSGETVNRVKMGYLKDRLFLTANQYAYQLATNPSSPPLDIINTPEDQISSPNQEAGYFYAYPSTDWEWTGFAQGPTAVYGAGYSGDVSKIFYSTIEVVDGEPTLVSPSVVAELPTGEIATSLISYLGTYIIIGTNLGVRIGVINSNGTISLGPETLTSNSRVTALNARGDYVWASGSNCDGQTGLFKIDLSQLTSENSIQFAYARNLCSDKNFSVSDRVESIVPIGYTGRIAFTIEDHGLMFEEANELMSSGWIETGKIRYDTEENKIFQYIRVNTEPSEGTIDIAYRDETAALTTLYTYDTDNVSTLETDASDGEPHRWLGYRFTLYRDSVDTTSGPALLSYQLKSQPANVIQRTIRLSLMCFQREQGSGKRVVERPVWERIQELEANEKKGAVVRYQDLNTGEEEYCLIEGVQFISEIMPESRSAQANPGGVLIVTLRAISPV